MKKNLIQLFAFATLGLASVMQVQAAQEIVVYSAFEAEDLSRYKKAFEKQNPDVKIKWVRDSTGVITAKLLAEKDNPRADAVWGLAASSLLVLKSEGMLTAYKPKGFARLDKRFVDKSSTPYWVGHDAWAAAVCVNTVELKKHKLPMPKTWKDLTKPVYKGHVKMPNPASSGTGFLDVSSWIQLFGEKQAWQYMDALNKNISSYTHSGSKPCKEAARGETTIGVSFAFRGANSKTAGAPIKVIIPSEGIGWDAESVAIIKGTDYPEAAKKLVDFAVSDAAMREYNVGFAILAVPALAKPVKNYPATVGKLMINNDFEWAAKNRERILAKWSKRYDGKSEKR